MSAERPHVEWLYAARGIAIVLVVAGHVERGLMSSAIAAGPFWSWLDYAVYSFHMPLFFLLAGLNVPPGLARGRPAFIRRKAWTVAYPYLLWSLLQGSLLVLLAPAANNPLAWSDLAAIGWKPISQFWFLYALLLYQAAILVLGPRLWPLFIASALSLAASSLCPSDSLGQVLLHDFPFFAAGIVLCDRLGTAGPRPPAHMIALFAAGFGLAVALSGWADGLNANLLAALPATVLGIATMLLVSQRLEGTTLQLAASIGRASMTIYVLHILVVASGRVLMLQAGIVPVAWAYFLVLAAVGVAVPLFAHRLMERCNMLPFLGLSFWRSASGGKSLSSPKIGMPNVTLSRARPIRKRR